MTDLSPDYLVQHVTEPRAMESIMHFDGARVVLRIEPAVGDAVEVDIDAHHGFVKFESEDTELRKEGAFALMQPPLAVFATRRQVIFSATCGPEPIEIRRVDKSPR